jgi:hypothetical protein
MALAGTALFGALVSGVTAVNGARAAPADRSSMLALGTVTAVDSALGQISVAYTAGAERDSEERSAVFLVDEEGRFPDGTMVAVRIDPDDPGNVRLASEPFDAIEPQVWGWLPAFVAGSFGVSWLLASRRNRRVGRTGWREVDAWRVHGTSLLAVARPDAPSASCLARVPPGVIERWPAPGGRDHVVHVAGSLSPGDPIAVRLDDIAVRAVWMAEAPPEPAAVERPGGWISRSAA